MEEGSSKQKNEGGTERGLDERRKQAEAEIQLNALMKGILEEGARERLNNIKIVNRELYLQAAQALLYLQRAGQLPKGKLSDAQLRQLLSKMTEKREIKIRRK